jgi:hypothetical protein
VPPGLGTSAGGVDRMPPRPPVSIPIGVRSGVRHAAMNAPLGYPRAVSSGRATAAVRCPDSTDVRLGYGIRVEEVAPARELGDQAPLPGHHRRPDRAPRVQEPRGAIRAHDREGLHRTSARRRRPREDRDWWCLPRRAPAKPSFMARSTASSCSCRRAGPRNSWRCEERATDKIAKDR